MNISISKRHRFGQIKSPPQTPQQKVFHVSALPSIAGEALKPGTCSAGKRATKPASWATAPQRAAWGLAFPPAPRTAPFRKKKKKKKSRSVTKTPTNDHRGIQFTVISPERFHRMFSGDVSGLRAEPSPPAALLPRGASALSSSRLFSAQPSPVEVIKGKKKKKRCRDLFSCCAEGGGERLTESIILLCC